MVNGPNGYTCSAKYASHTVGGRNPAPVDKWLSMFIPLFKRFQPSKVVQDFFHPQYVIGFEWFVLTCPHLSLVVAHHCLAMFAKFTAVLVVCRLDMTINRINQHGKA